MMTTYGLQLPKFTFTVPDDGLFEHVAAMATAADDGGFTSLWVMDHFYQLPGLGGADDKMLEGYTLLGALAARTSRVTLGTLVTGVTYRNPALLAKEVTTLDIISAGRAVLGIGAAWYDVEHEGLGVDFPPPGERLGSLFLASSADEAEQLRQGVAGAMGEEWTQEAATFGDADSVAEQLQALVDAGAQELIFNLPLANNADDVTAAGEVLKKALS